MVSWNFIVEVHLPEAASDYISRQTKPIMEKNNEFEEKKANVRKPKTTVKKCKMLIFTNNQTI